MPWFSYHGGHSGQFCRHAKGRLREVVERAYQLGFTHYGLSEHCPRYRAEDLFPDESDLTPDDLVKNFQAYTREALSLRDEFADRLEVLVGFETERLPPDRWAETMRQLRGSADFDYVIGSVHDVDGICIDYSAQNTAQVAAALGGVRAMQLAYFESLIDVIETLRPEVVGHIDLIRKFDGEGASFEPALWPTIDRALEAAKASDAMLDVNPGAFRRGLSPVYPLPAILERAQRMGVAVTLGDDGHGAHDVGAGLQECLAAIAAAGYREVSYLARVDGTLQKLRSPLEEVRPHRQ